MQEYRLNSIQASLRYHDLPGEDTPIVFIHGLGCAGSLDYPQVAAQPELSGHRRIVLDMLGAGYSDKPENFGYTVSGHAEYLAEWVDAIGLKGFVLFGHSLGGAVALALAEKRRDRISRLILGEANLDAGGGFASRAIASYSEQDFAGHGLADYTSRQRQEGNQLGGQLVLVVPACGAPSIEIGDCRPNPRLERDPVFADLPQNVYIWRAIAARPGYAGAGGPRRPY